LSRARHFLLGFRLVEDKAKTERLLLLASWYDVPDLIPLTTSWRYTR
jgi:hypothetical protein